MLFRYPNPLLLSFLQIVYDAHGVKQRTTFGIPHSFPNFIENLGAEAKVVLSESVGIHDDFVSVHQYTVTL